jgi:hypothetical protein
VAGTGRAQIDRLADRARRASVSPVPSRPSSRQVRTLRRRNIRLCAGCKGADTKKLASIGGSASALVITQCNCGCQRIQAPVGLADPIISCPGTALNAACEDVAAW